MARNTFSVLQHNLQHSAGATEGLIKNLHEKGGAFVCLIQEPYLYKQDIKLYHRGVDVHRGLDNSPRACILSSPDMGLLMVPEFSGRDITTCRCEDKLDNKEVYFVSVYSDIEIFSIHPKLVQLVDYAENKSIELVIGIDSNAHSTVWGCQTNNQRTLDQTGHLNPHLANQLLI